MKHTLLSLLKVFLSIVFICLVINTFAQPTDNPIATFYNSSPYATEGYPAWTDSIKWSNVINMGTYSNGANDFQKFENARDQLYAAGGGVLYYPAGTYNFKDHPTDPNGGRGLHLKKGVVIRGVAPTTNKWAVKDTSNISDDSGLSGLTTIFVFPTWDKKTTPKYELSVVSGNGKVPQTWNQIGLMPVGTQTIKDVNMVGICWVKLQFATVYFGGDMPWGATYGTAGAWKSSSAKTTNNHGQNWAARVPDGTHPFDPFTGAAPNLPYINGAKNRLVFGCRFENAVVHDDIWTHGSYAGGDSAQMAYFGSRFCARIIVDGENILVANNIIPKPTECFLFNMKVNLLITKTTGQWYSNTEMEDGCISGCNSRKALRTVMYDYARSIGFDINKSLNSERINRNLLTFTDKGPYYSDNVVVIDNYTYQHGNKGYEIAGKWTIVKRNVRKGDVLDAYNHAYKAGSTRVSDNVYGLSTSVNNVAGQNRGWFNSLSGGPDCKYTDDNMSRAFDVAGWNMWFSKNRWDGTGSLPGVDGEGILFQRMSCVEVFSVAETNNFQGPCGGSGGGYIYPYNVHIMGMLQGWNNGTQIGNYCKTGDRQEDFSVVGNTNIKSLQTCTAGLVLDIMNQSNCPAATSVAPSNLVVLRDNVAQCNIISWFDQAIDDFDEVGFEVQRREKGTSPWTTIAIRPRNQTGGVSHSDNNALYNSGIAVNPDNWTYPGSDISVKPIDPRAGTEHVDLNPQQWRDYLINPSKDYEYRVIAMACNQSDKSAASSVVADGGLDKPMPFVSDNISYFIWPTVTQDELNVRLENNVKGSILIDIVDLTGKIIIEKMLNKNQDVLNIQLNLSELVKGLYIVNIKMKNNKTISEKIIKQ